MEFVLILFMSIGPFSDKDSMALATVTGFSTEQECQVAGQKASAQFNKGTKEAKFVCVQRKAAK